MNRLFRGLAFVVAVLVLGNFSALSALSARAATLADHVPADAIYYFGWKGGDALKADYGKSNLKGFVDASGIPAWVNDRSEWLLKKVKEEEPEAEEPLKLALSVAGKMWKHPMAFYFGGIVFAEKDQALRTRIALICDAGDDADALIKEVQPMLDKANKANAKVPVWIKKDNGIVVFGVGSMGKGYEPALLGTKGAAKETVLTESKEFKAAMAEVDGDAALTMYLNMDRVIAQFETLSKDLPAEKKEVADRVVAALGLGSISQIAMTGSFSGKEWVDKSFVGLKGEDRSGITAFFAPKPMDETLLKWVPQEASSFQVMRLDIPDLWDKLRDVVKAAGDEHLKQFDRTATQFKRQVGLDLRKDVLAGLDDTLLYYNLPSTEDAPSEAVALIKLRDEKKLAASIEALLAKMEEEGTDIGIKKEKLAGVEATIGTIDTKSAAWGPYKGWMVVSTPEGFERAIKQIKAGKKSILDNEKFVAARKSLGEAPGAVSVDFHDPAVLYQDFLKNAVLLMIAANVAGADLPANFLPDAPKVEKFMTPGASVTWTDAKGSHCVSRSAMPGSSMMAGQFNGGPVVMAAGVAFSAAMVAGIFAEPKAELEELP